ncbi:VWA domain-containing protein [Mycolicibacterium sp. YH-1]|uniref:VWA domain-containing protein n=1 Tax=Mycolicibacterium sp. YH-1 TaxID=2908837 RepID=UPI001F4C3CBF|nr:VWA domain-containing protein [Mycolicibacterium sp. YH-1]UNB53535.1 VWA domain-containing protein [Mycolicibacterium sp. YH-1]
MNLPVLGPLPLSGFTHIWFFLFLFVVAGLVFLYFWIQRSRKARLARFADSEMIGSVAPKPQSRWHHLPPALVAVALVMFTIAMAGPALDRKIPRNRAVVMLVMDVSTSMDATDVSPSRMKAAQAAAKKFADELTPGVNLGLISFAANPTMLSSPTTNHEATKVAIDKMQVAERTATGEAIFAALQAISTVGAVIGGGDEPPPARIVLFSDGKETSPGNPDNPRGAFTAARAAKDQGIPISTIAFGTPDGTVKVDNADVPVPVDDTTMKQVAQLSGGTSYLAQDAPQLDQIYKTLQDQIGYETVRGDASTGWLRLGALVLAIAAISALVINRRLPL